MDVLGPFPPPYGGVSVHIRRLRRLLVDEGIEVRVFSTAGADESPNVVEVGPRPLLFLLRYLLRRESTVVYLASARRGVWLYGAVLATVGRRYVVLRLQNDFLIRRASNPLRRQVAALILRRFHCIVAVNTELCDLLLSLGVPASRVVHLPGFLPPDADELATQGVPSEAREFAERHKPLVLASGRVEFLDGHDLYGFDLLIHAAVDLAPEFPNLGVLFVLWDYSEERDADRLAALTKIAHAAGIDQNITFCVMSGPMIPLLLAADVFVRPTYCDGDANSVREALGLGIHVVASDGVIRPPEAMLFRNRDRASLVGALRATLLLPTSAPDAAQLWVASQANGVAHVSEIRRWFLEGG